MHLSHKEQGDAATAALEVGGSLLTASVLDIGDNDHHMVGRRVAFEPGPGGVEAVPVVWAPAPP